MSELKPCPFCGNDPEHNDGGNSTYGRLWWSVWCEPCGVTMNDNDEWDFAENQTGKFLHPEKECFARWNSRVPSYS